jgi:hypothetical protein
MIWAFRVQRWVGEIQGLFLSRGLLVLEGTRNLRSGKIEKKNVSFFGSAGYFVLFKFNGRLLRLNSVIISALLARARTARSASLKHPSRVVFRR